MRLLKVCFQCSLFLTGDPGSSLSSPLCSGECPVMVTQDRMCVFYSLVFSFRSWSLGSVGGCGLCFTCILVMGGISLCLCITYHRRPGLCPLRPLAHLQFGWTVSSPQTTAPLKHPSLSFSLPSVFPCHLKSCSPWSASGRHMLRLPYPQTDPSRLSPSFPQWVSSPHPSTGFPHLPSPFYDSLTCAFLDYFPSKLSAQKSFCQNQLWGELFIRKSNFLIGVWAENGFSQ